MGWFALNTTVGDKNTTSNTQTNESGTQTPVLSPQWNTAFNNASGNLNANGATPAQQSAMNFAKNQTSFSGYDANGNLINPATAALNNANTNLQPLKTQLGGYNNYWDARSGQPNATSSAVTSALPPSIMAKTAASGVAPYSALYSQEMIDPSLKAMDYGTDRAFSALDARTAGAGGFANSRSGLGYSDLGTQSALQRGQLESQLKNLGLTNAISAATGDVSRGQQADTQNASNIMGTNEFNAAAGQQNNQFNVQSGITQQAGRDAAISNAQANIAQQAGLTQQQAANVVTANGINTDAAAALFQSGQITQAQLNQILQLAQTANGQQFAGNTGSSTNSNVVDVNGGFGFK